MPKKRVTSKMVAKRAGVSQTTVSFVLNKVEGQNISEETQQRVYKAAEELGYVPDAAARTLARGVSDNIALVLTQPHDAVFSDEYVAYVLTGIVQVVREQGFRVFVEMVDTLKQSETYTQLAKGKEVAGLVVLPYQSRRANMRDMLKLSNDGFPIVLIGRMSSDNDQPEQLPSVLINSALGIQSAMRHLLKLGHQRIGAISYAPEGSTHESAHRIRIYQMMLEEYDITFDETLVAYANYTPQSAVDAMNTLLSLDDKPKAILALNDVMAFGAMKAIHQHGLRVPEDIAIVGYDGIHLAPFANPALTTIDAPNVEQGRRAAEMLLNLINSKSPESRHIELQPQLIIRESCGYYLKQTKN
ncbi:MAG: LacI family DNA-binding transcriptional regulator [Chloroflexota bacterium]